MKFSINLSSIAIRFTVLQCSISSLESFLGRGKKKITFTSFRFLRTKKFSNAQTPLILPLILCRILGLNTMLLCFLVLLLHVSQSLAFEFSSSLRGDSYIHMGLF